MPSIGIAQYRSAAGLASPTAPTRTAVVAAIEYAGALPATAITTVSNVPRSLACSPLPLLLLMDALLSVLHDVGGCANRPRTRRGMASGQWPVGTTKREGWIPVEPLRRRTVTPCVGVMIAVPLDLSRLTSQ